MNLTITINPVHSMLGYRKTCEEHIVTAQPHLNLKNIFQLLHQPQDSPILPKKAQNDPNNHKSKSLRQKIKQNESY